MTRADRFDRRAPDRLGHVKIGLADRQIDRALHLGRQVKYPANARAIERSHALGDPRVWHGDWQLLEENDKRLGGSIILKLRVACALRGRTANIAWPRIRDFIGATAVSAVPATGKQKLATRMIASCLLREDRTAETGVARRDSSPCGPCYRTRQRNRSTPPSPGSIGLSISQRRTSEFPSFGSTLNEASRLD